MNYWNEWKIIMIRMIKDNAMGIFMAVVFVLVILVMIVAIKEDMKWQKFVKDNNCYVVRKEPDDVSTSIQPMFVGDHTIWVPQTTVTPGRKLWHCDNREEFWR